jgi:hypothetical protein
VGGGIQDPLGTAATNGLLCQPRLIMMMEKLVEWLAGETELLGENLPQCHFVHHKPHMVPGREPRPAAVGSQRLTAWATARPLLCLCYQGYDFLYLTRSQYYAQFIRR